VLRGGSFFSDARLARCAYRNDFFFDNFYNNIGFRVVASHAFPLWKNPKGLEDL